VLSERRWIPLDRRAALAALALGTACPHLRAQEEPASASHQHRAVATTLVRALSNLIATQASTYARTGVFSWDPWQERADSLVTLEILEASRTGWSAIALHRADAGVRCAVVVGSAGPLLNAPRGADRPYCVAEDGSALPQTGATPDSTWVFWWQDEVLDTPPEQLSCPSLKIPKLPKRNDSVYVAFVVGVDGLVEPGGIALESTGSLIASVATLMRLSGCTFRPATFRGAPVRAIMRHRIGLAPREPDAPPPVEEFPNDPIRRPAVVNAMRAALDDVAAAQARRHEDRGVYAADVSDLHAGIARDPAVRVVMLSWGATGWSAVAFHDSTGMRCVIAVGDSIPVPARPSRAGTPRCTGSEGEAVVDSLPPTAWDAPDPPQRKDCNSRLQFRHDPARRVRVTLEFVVGVDGKPEPRTLRILDGSGLEDDAGAVQILAGCTYRPARDHGKPMRVLVRQPVYFN